MKQPCGLSDGTAAADPPTPKWRRRDAGFWIVFWKLVVRCLVGTAMSLFCLVLSGLAWNTLPYAIITRLRLGQPEKDLLALCVPLAAPVSATGLFALCLAPVWIASLAAAYPVARRVLAGMAGIVAGLGAVLVWQYGLGQATGVGYLARHAVRSSVSVEDVAGLGLACLVGLWCTLRILSIAGAGGLLSWTGLRSGQEFP